MPCFWLFDSSNERLQLLLEEFLHEYATVFDELMEQFICSLPALVVLSDGLFRLFARSCLLLNNNGIAVCALLLGLKV